MSDDSRLSRRTYSFDEVYEWSTNVTKRQTPISKKSGPMVKVLTIGSIILILGLILWLVFKKKKKATDPENEYVCLETGVTITLDELNSGQYEVVTVEN